MLDRRGAVGIVADRRGKGNGPEPRENRIVADERMPRTADASARDRGIVADGGGARKGFSKKVAFAIFLEKANGPEPEPRAATVSDHARMGR